MIFQFSKKELSVPGEVEHTYKEVDNIRLVFEDNQLIGWYNPEKDNTD